MLPFDTDHHGIFLLLPCRSRGASSPFGHSMLALRAIHKQARPLALRSFSSIGLEYELFGTTQGAKVTKYTLSNENGMEVELTNYGATVLSVKTPDKAGKFEEVTMQYSTLEEIMEKSPFYGSTCGRVANRIANGKFSLGGEDYTLAVNNGPNHLHGGDMGFDKCVWEAEEVIDNENARTGVIFTYFS